MFSCIHGLAKLSFSTEAQYFFFHLECRASVINIRRRKVSRERAICIFRDLKIAKHSLGCFRGSLQIIV